MDRSGRLEVKKREARGTAFESCRSWAKLGLAGTACTAKTMPTLLAHLAPMTTHSSAPPQSSTLLCSRRPGRRQAEAEVAGEPNVPLPPAPPAASGAPMSLTRMTMTTTGRLDSDDDDGTA